ncbi:MAG: aryl-sulfate sulfotransferase [Bacteroidota bacterium]
MKQYLSLLFVMLGAFSYPLAGQTVGLISAQPEAFPGYTLLAPTAATTTYLIDPCGYLVNFWESDFNPGAVAYLGAGGRLFRTARLGSPFNAGGAGGRVEEFDWDGNLVWGFDYAGSTFHQHHDIEILPNGNILILAWESKTFGEAIEAGRNPQLLSPAGVWPEHIIEIKPVGTDEAEIVWEWYLWDHLVQDYDPNQANFGVVADHPELIDLNYAASGSGPNSEDWIHANAIDYNPTLDQIIISARDFNELWVIDHSTTTAEAAGHTGGNAGMGGDILYRWGNPAAYQRGTEDDRKLWLQHDGQWIAEGLPGAGQIMVFNNGAGRTPSFSSVDVWTPPLNPDGTYLINSGEAYGPEDLSWTYSDPNPTSFFSPRVSGAQRLPNGNTLICEGVEGRLFEVDEAGTIQWEYINPIGFNGPASQGDNPFGNDLFRGYRYIAGGAELGGIELVSAEPLEIDPIPYDCDLVDSSMVSSVTLLDYGLKSFVEVVQNPFQDLLQLEKNMDGALQVIVYRLDGVAIQKFEMLEQEKMINTSAWRSGYYYLAIWSEDGIPQRPIQLIKF